MPTKNYYKILQVDPSAEQAIIKAAYRTLMLDLKKHPDCGGNDIDAGSINEAYEMLNDPVQRKQYDQNNYFNMSNSSNLDDSKYYYMRCYFCGSVNRIQLNENNLKLKSISCGKCHSPFFSQTMKEHGVRQQKRKHTRFKCQFTIDFQLGYRKNWIKGSCMDLSSNGMKFKSPIPLKKNQIIKIKFENDRKFQAIAKVIRAIKKNIHATPIYECAVSYIEARYENPTAT